MGLMSRRASYVVLCTMGTSRSRQQCRKLLVGNAGTLDAVQKRRGHQNDSDSRYRPEDREQRVLNEKRVPDLADYTSENEEDYLFSSITASYKTEPRFEPYR
jgi:DNA-sulfur modification-associated